MKKKKRKVTVIDWILIGDAAAFFIFNTTMIVIHCIYQQTPDTLITCVDSVLGGEGIIAFAIWWIKKRYASKYEKEDRENGEG